MKEVSELVFSFFTGLTYFNSVMSNRLSPIVEIEGAEFPFSIYRILEGEQKTKEAKEYQIELLSYFSAEKYIECVDFEEKIKKEIEDAGVFELVNSNSDFVAEDRSFVCIINLKIIK